MALLSATISIMGIPVRFTSEDEDLLAAAVTPFEIWLDSPMSGAPRGIEVRLSVLRGSPRRNQSTGIQVDDGLLRMVGDGTRSEADAVGEFAECAVAPEFIGDPDRLAGEVIDTVVLFLLTRRGRVPIHAAGVVDGDTAIVLAGPSGVGKSTLALASVEDGLKLLSDDTVYVQARPVFRVWGYPRPIRLQHEAGAGPLRWRKGDDSRKGGRLKANVRLLRDEVRTHADRAVLCLLSRRGTGKRRPIELMDAIDRSLKGLDPGFDHFRDELPFVLRRLARLGAWEVDLAHDSDRNVGLIRDVAGEVALHSVRRDRR